MSVKNFYQTFYQTDTLFRVAGERWETTAEAASHDAVDVLPSTDSLNSSDLLAELDELSAGKPILSEDTLLVDISLTVPLTPAPEPTPALVIAVPEPLPQSPPRPTTPSILPPVQQQPRMPQLNHKVLLLADEELDPSNLLFLEKILKAVNLNIDGVDLLNLHGVQGMDFAELLRGKYINHFITFGVPFERINLDIMMDRYSPVRFEGITFLMADSLPTIEADQALKKRLWGSLQRVFRL
jgi:DNA polymerase III psi subunit